MFPLEQGAFEMLLIGAIALIVVGPKDLPVLMRRVGQFTAKMRGMAAEFRSSFDEMARQSELDELRKEVEALRTGSYTAPISAEIDEHLSDFNPYPTGYPSPPVEESNLSPRETGGGDQAQLGEGGEPQTLSPSPPPPPASPVPLPRDAGEEKMRKPRAKKITAVIDTPEASKPAAKPRAPRKPKAAPAAHEAEG